MGNEPSRRHCNSERISNIAQLPGQKLNSSPELGRSLDVGKMDLLPLEVKLHEQYDGSRPPGRVVKFCNSIRTFSGPTWSGARANIK